MYHPSTPVIVWPLDRLTITAGTCWVHLTGTDGAVCATFRGSETRDLLSAVEHGLAFYHSRPRTMRGANAKNTTTLYRPADESIVLRCNDVMARLYPTVAEDLAHWLHLCNLEQLPGYVPRHGEGSAVELRAASLRLQQGGTSIDVPFHHGELAAYLLAAIQEPENPEPLPSEGSFTDGSFWVHHEGDDTDRHTFLYGRGFTKAMSIPIYRSELAHLAMTIYDRSPQGENHE